MSNILFLKACQPVSKLCFHGNPLVSDKYLIWHCQLQKPVICNREHIRTGLHRGSKYEIFYTLQDKH